MMRFAVIIQIVCLAWLVIAVAARAISGRKAKAITPGPVCGSCGYSTIGLARMICPECGSDLRAVGIDLPRSSVNGAWTLAMSIISLTLAIVITAVATTALIVELLPQKQVFSYTASFNGPFSNAYLGAQISGSEIGFNPVDRRIPLLLTLKLLNGSSVHLRIGAPATTETADGEMLESLTDFDARAILGWMSKHGLDVENRHVIDEAGAISVAIQKGVRVVAQNRDSGRSASYANSTFNFGRATSSASSASVAIPWSAQFLCAVWTIIWSIGIWFIMWPRRKDSPRAK